jgi:ATP-citrate lyase beta-subunit
MSRVAITEYAAKRLYIGDSYTGLTVTKNTLKDALSKLAGEKSYVVKIDVGIKKRGIQKLIALDVPGSEINKIARNFFDQGYERCLIEPYIKHEQREEKYLSLSIERDGLRVMHSLVAGVEIEKHQDSVQTWIVPRSEAFVPSPFTHENGPVELTQILETMQKYHFSFLEMNPYVISSKHVIPIDITVEIDTAGQRHLPAWVSEHIISKITVSAEEKTIVKLNETSQASFNLHVLNHNGSILTLFSGGGASLIALDTLVASSLQDRIINYCEYSGAPTREETSSFTDTLLSLLLKSNSDKKVVLIAGGVSNFTDIFKTFQGIVDALKKNIDSVKKEDVCFVVRRGGLNQTEGLSYLEDFFVRNKIRHEVHGPDLSLGEVGSIIKKYL